MFQKFVCKYVLEHLGMHFPSHHKQLIYFNRHSFKNIEYLPALHKSLFLAQGKQREMRLSPVPPEVHGITKETVAEASKIYGMQHV